MTRIYLVRHAQAEGNLYRRAHGSYDSLITPQGYAQIEALKKRFESVHVDVVYTSPRYRARTTAAAISNFLIIVLCFSGFTTANIAKITQRNQSVRRTGARRAQNGHATGAERARNGQRIADNHSSITSRRMASRYPRPHFRSGST